MPQKILITGATGLIGQALTKALVAKGYVVHYLTTSKAKIKNTPSLKGYFWNPQNNIIDVDCLDGVETIIHLAGASIAKRWTKSYKETIIKSRTRTLDCLLQHLQRNTNSVKRLISASGVGIYPSSKTATYTEDSTDISEGFLGNVVYQWESATKPFEAMGIKVSKVRTGIVLDKHQGILPQMTTPVKWFAGGCMGNGEQFVSWIHIKDLVALFLFLLEKQLDGIFNAVAPQPVTHRTFMKNIGKTIKRPIWLPLPRWTLKLILGKMSALLFESQKVLPKRISSEGFSFEFDILDCALENILRTN